METFHDLNESLSENELIQLDYIYHACKDKQALLVDKQLRLVTKVMFIIISK